MDSKQCLGEEELHNVPLQGTGTSVRGVDFSLSPCARCVHVTASTCDRSHW